MRMDVVIDAPITTSVRMRARRTSQARKTRTTASEPSGDTQRPAVTVSGALRASAHAGQASSSSCQTSRPPGRYVTTGHPASISASASPASIRVEVSEYVRPSAPTSCPIRALARSRRNGSDQDVDDDRDREQRQVGDRDVEQLHRLGLAGALEAAEQPVRLEHEPGAQG